MAVVAARHEGAGLWRARSPSDWLGRRRRRPRARGRAEPGKPAAAEAERAEAAGFVIVAPPRRLAGFGPRRAGPLGSGGRLGAGGRAGSAGKDKGGRGRAGGFGEGEGRGGAGRSRARGPGPKRPTPGPGLAGSRGEQSKGPARRLMQPAGNTLRGWAELTIPWPPPQSSWGSTSDPPTPKRAPRFGGVLAGLAGPRGGTPRISGPCMCCSELALAHPGDEGCFPENAQMGLFLQPSWLCFFFFFKAQDAGRWIDAGVDHQRCSELRRGLCTLALQESKSLVLSSRALMERVHAAGLSLA